jgi:FtsZ-binding cell division protein ZapB
MNNRPSKDYINGEKPKIGDTVSARDIGRRGRAIFIWEACSQCGTERWVRRIYSGQLCKSCALRNHSYGENNRRWNNKRSTITKSGIRIYVNKEHPYFCMAHKCALDYAILEHRLVMAEHLGRPLEQHEVVHHIDGNNLNNKISNLQLLPNQATHQSYTLLQIQINKLKEENNILRDRVTVLEADIVVLKHNLELQGNPELNWGMNP